MAKPKNKISASIQPESYNGPDPYELQVFLDQISVGLMAFDRNGTVTLWNHVLEQLTGIPRAEVLGRASTDVFPFLTLTPDEQTVTLLEQQINRWGVSGAPLYFDIQCNPMRDGEGHHIGFSATLHDVTHRKLANVASQQQIDRYQYIIESITDGFFVLDSEWNFIYINEEAAQMLKRPREEMIGNTIWGMFPEAVDSPFYLEYRRAMKQQVCVMFQAYFEPLDLWTEVRAYPIKDGLSVHFSDITERQRLSEVKDQHFQTLFEDHPDAILSFDLRGQCMRFNKVLVELSGYSEQELVGHTLQLLFSKHDLKSAQQYFRKAATGTPQVYEAQLHHKSGRIVEIKVSNIPIIVNDQIVGVYGIFQDISEHKQAEGELRATKDRLEAFLYNSADAIWMIDLQDRVLQVNPAFESLFGWSEQEVLGNGLPIIPAAQHAEIEALHQQIKEGYSISGFETQRLCKDGRLLYVSATLSPVRDISGRVVGVSGTCRDITESKKTQEILLQSEKLSIAGQLAAGVAHEIRNPLTALKGFVQLMRFGEGYQERYLHVMASELERIEMIVSELLVLAKPQAMTFKRKQLVPILDDVLTLSSTQAILHNVQIQTQFAEDLPELDCDDNQLKQVFINFIKNAIEAMPEGGTLQIVAQVENGERVRISVRDKGMGIPQEHLARLGEPFYTTKTKGTGLGLMVSKKIIEHHHGTLEISSEMGVGTQVDVYLPFP